MVVSDAIHNIMGGMESTAGVRLHNHRRKLKQRFDIIKRLGQGTYGKVQLGINKETGQEVAIKTIKKSKIETDADLIRIRREIQIMSSVQHPNIIHIYEVFENREKMVLVMEYAAGGELYDYLSERKVLDESEARRIFRQISTAVYYCHKHKICHRDLKLENILLDEHGSAKIADFGLSNVFDEHRLLGTFCGSPLYASPEIVKGTPYHGPEVDCWSLGVLLYTLVYGAMPFDGSNFKRLVKQISQGDYFEPKKPSPASSLIRDMLNVNPACRANIENICAHRWVNESQAQSCVEIAEELANQTPVRLDLLLSLAPPPVSADALLVSKDLESTAAGPARSQSVGSLMELDHPRSFDAEKRRLSEAGQLPGTSVKESPPKRKLEQGPSTEEANQSGAKRKERSRHREREHSTERRQHSTERRQHRSTSRSKQSERQSTSKAESPKKVTSQEPSQIPLPVETKATENAVEKHKDVPESMEVDVMEVPQAADVTEKVIKNVEESKDIEVLDGTSKTVGKSVTKNEETTAEETKLNEEAKKVKVKRKKKTSDLKLPDSKEDLTKADENVPKKEVESQVKDSSHNGEASTKDEIVPKDVITSAGVINGDKSNDTTQESQVVKPEAPAEVKEKKVIKKIGTVKKKSDLSSSKIAQAADKSPTNEESTSPTKPMVRRRSKIFESEIQKFNNLSAADIKTPVVEKPKKVFIPGVKVSDFKKAYERKSSVDLSSTTSVPNAVKTSTKKAVNSEKSGSDSQETSESQPSTESNALELTNDSLESSNKPADVPSTESPLKPDQPITPPDNVTITSETSVTVPTTKEPQEQTSDKTKTVLEAKPEPIVSPTERPVAKDESAKKKAVAIIGNAIAKPPKPTLDKLKLRNTSVKSPPDSPKKKSVNEESPGGVSPSGKKLVKIQVGPNDVRNATLQVSTPEQIQNFKYNEAAKTEAGGEENVAEKANAVPSVDDKERDRKKSSKVEIVLKSATLPRRKTSKAEIQLGAPKPVPEYRSEVEHMVGTQPGDARLKTQRSEVAFPVAAAQGQPAHRSASVEPEGAVKPQPPKERIIPIQFERPVSVASPPPSKPPVPPLSQQRSMSQGQRSSSLSRQSTLDSDTESAATVSGGPEPIRKSPREYIIPIAVEGGGYVTPRATSLEPDPPSEAAHKPRKPHRFPRTLRMGSLLSDGGLSEDEGFNSISSPFSTLNRHREGEGEDDKGGLNHMHRLRSSRPSRRATLEHADSLSSAEEEEDDDDDGFELLTAESLFSTLLSRVRNLTQRLNVDDTRTGFPSSRFINHNFPSHSPFWGNMEPLSRRVSETSRPSRDESGSSWRRSVSRDTDCDSQYSDATNSNAPSSLPRGSSRHDFDEMSDISNSSYPSYYTPSLARRIQRTNQELRNRSSSNLDSSYGPLPPRDYTTLPSRRPMSRTTSLKSQDGARRPVHFVPTRSPSCLDSSRNTDKSRSFERSGSVERYVPQVGNGDSGYLRGNTSENSSFDRDSSISRRSTSYLGSKSCMGSCDSLNSVGKKDFSREHAKRISESESTKSYLPPTRRNIGTLEGSYSNSLPRRHPYRSSMSDMADYTRKKPDDYRSHSRISEEVNNYDHETLPPLPQSSSYIARKREGGAPKSSSYLRQRAIDIANIYGAPLPAAEPTRLERDLGNGTDQTYDSYRSGTATPTNQDHSTLSKSSFEDRMAMKYGDGEQRGRSLIPKVSRFRSSSLSREEDSSRSESVREAIIRRQKSFDKLDQSQDKARKPKLQRPLSLSLQTPSDSSVLSKFFNGDVGGRETNGKDTLNVEDNKPTSPVRSPSRRVSRFLRPDFYDTPREESTFAKEKDEAAKEKEVDDQKQEKESDHNYNNLGAKLASKMQINNSETEVNRVVVDHGKTNGLAHLESQSESLQQKVVVNSSQPSSSNANAASEQKVSTNSVKSGLSKSIEIPTVSESVVSMEPKIAKVFKPKVAIKKDPPFSLPKSVEGSVKIPDANISKDSELKCINKDPVETLPKPIFEKDKCVPLPVSNNVRDIPLKKALQTDQTLTQMSMNNVPNTETVTKGINIPNASTKTVMSPASNNVKDIPSKTALQTDKTLTYLKANNAPDVSQEKVGNIATQEAEAKVIQAAECTGKVFNAPDVSQEKVGNIVSQEAETKVAKAAEGTGKVFSDPDVSQEKVGNIVTQEAETKIAKAAEGTGKVKIKKKIIKKSVGSDSVKKSIDSQAIMVKSAASVKLTDTAQSTPTVKQTSAESGSNENKTDVYVEKDVKASFGKSRIDQVIRCLRERSLTPKGSDDMLTVSNLLKRAVSVDNCSSDPNVAKSTNKIKKVIKSLKELTSAPKTNQDTESSLLKRAVSVDDCSNPSQTKPNKVNSVLGIFRKMEEPKVDPKAEKKASLLSRFRKTQSLYAGSASDSVLVQNLDKVEVKEKAASKGRKFGFRGTKSDKTNPSVESEASDAIVSGTNPSQTKTSENGLPNTVTLDSNSNVSCSIKIKLPDKDVVKHSKQNGTLNGNDKDVSVSTTIKVVKDVTKENGSKSNKSIDATDTSAIKKIVNTQKGCAENGFKSDANSKSGNYSKIPQMTTNNVPTCNDEKAGGVVGLVSSIAGKSKDFDPVSSSSVPSEEDMESFDDSCSVCSDWEFRTSPLLAYQHRPAEPEGSETMQERIRRKSFFSRFNDSKKIPVAVRRTSTSAIPLLRETSMLSSSTNHTRHENRPDEI